MMIPVLLVVSFLVAYLVGSVPVGLLVGRWVGGIDIRRYGTGNIGASNVLRHLGFVPAAIVGVASFLQGLLPALLLGWLSGSQLCLAAAAVGSVVGYAWSFLLRLRGGSAVGAATGALTALWPAGLLPLLGFYAAGGVLRRPAPFVLLGLLAVVALAKATSQPQPILLAASLVVAAVVLKRLDGLWADLGRAPAGAVLISRLVHDRRPGRPLVGRID